mgnify:CR=1 FL=1
MTGNQLLTPVSEDDENGKLLARIEAALDRLDRLTGVEALRRTAAEAGADDSDSKGLQAENADLKQRLETLESREATRRATINDVTTRVDRAIGNLDTVLKG